MAEVANNNIIDRGIDLGREAQELILEGIDRLKTAFGIVTVLRGKLSNGKDHAIVLGVDSPPELLTGTDDTKESVGFLSKLRNNQLARLAGGIGLAAGAVVGIGSALGGCSTSPDSHNQPAGIYGTQSSALTLDQVLNVGPGQEIPWSEPGDYNGANYAEMNGKKYIFVGRNKTVVYVECDAIEACLTANADEVKTVQGLSEAGLEGTYSGPGVFQDQNGNNKFIVDPGNFAGPEGAGWSQMCDIAPNANGTLEVSNCAEIDPPMGHGPSIFPKNEIPHALWPPGKIRNLYTNVTQETALYDTDWAYDCGVGVETDSAVIGSQKQVIQGVTHCRLVTAATWQELNDAPIALNSLNNGSNLLRHARLAAGNVLIYTREPKGAPENEKLWYALIPDLPQNSEQDAGDTGAPDAAQPDSAVIDEPDAIDGSEADAQPDPADVAQDVADAADAVLPPEEDETPDAGPDLQPQPDAESDTGPDTSPLPDAQPDTPLDTSASPCDFANPKINIQPGCQLENCSDPFADITGKCTFSVDLGKANPVIIELDGTYQIDFLEKIGAHLAGKYKVVDNGNIFNTVTGNLITGVEGTTYSGEFMAGSNYLLSCQEGTIKVFLIKMNGEKELLATLDGGESQIFDMNNPQPEPQPEPATDAGQPEPDKDASQPEPVPDTGPTQPEPKPASDTGNGTEPINPQPETTDTTTPPAQKPPSNDGGCSIAGNLGTTKENPNSAGHLATLAMAMLALGATIRRKQEQQSSKPASRHSHPTIHSTILNSHPHMGQSSPQPKEPGFPSLKFSS